MATRQKKTQLARLPERADMPRRVAVMRARYDTAQTTDENRRHWAAADGFSPDAANNLAVRMILRNRCRYVFANNPRAKGMIRTLANHTVGTGPRLQMQLGEGSQARKLNARIESDFAAWAKEIKLAKKLRILRIARAISGEIFGVLGMNSALDNPVQLDIRMIEADRVSNPAMQFSGHDADGVFFDDFGNPESYRILKTHPGGMFRMFGPNDFQDFPARLVSHYFNQERPEQHRGIPDITPAVQLIEEGRRFRAAVLGAAETAADFAMALETDAPADPDEPTSTIAAMDTVELSRRLATVLPKGFKLTQTKAEQPTTTFKEFSRELLAEVARCLEMPLSLASLDANDANMSSSYIINQPYENAIHVDRGDIERDFLEPLFDAWLTLAFDPNGNAPLSRRMPGEFPHGWFWPLIGEHADPSKVAAGQVQRLENNLTTLSREYAREGLDWEFELRQRAKEFKLQKELGLPNAQAIPPPRQPGDTTNAQDTLQG